MKKILLASTALVLSAGIASAQGVSISGTARMGIIGVNGGAGWVWNLENRMTLNFSATVEADHGLTFGAWMRARNTANSSNGLSGSRVWVEANGLRLTFGNVDGAIRGAGTAFGYAGGCGVGYVGGILCGDTIGLLGSHGQNSTGAIADQRVRLDYSMGDYSVAVSHDRFANTTEIGARGSFGAFTVAAGYRSAAVDYWTLSGQYNGGSWTVGAIVAGFPGVNNWQINGTAEVGGGTAYAFVGNAFGANTWGVNYSYGLGGGASVVAGAERLGGVTAAAIGVNFSF